MVSNLSQQVLPKGSSSNTIAFVPAQCGGGPFKVLIVKTSQTLTEKCLYSDIRGNLSLKEFDLLHPHPGTLFLVTGA